MTFSDQLRAAIRMAGVSQYAIARQAGVTESSLSRFMRGKQTLALRSVDKVATLLGLGVATGLPRTLVQPTKVGRPRKERG